MGRPRVLRPQLRRDSLGGVGLAPKAGMPSIRCPRCGKEHDLAQGEVGYQLPDDFFALSEAERAERGHANEDLCELDGRSFIRGVLLLPIRGESRDFGWGVWAEVEASVFQRYLELFAAPNQETEPPFVGRLANTIPGYESTIGVPISIALTGPKTRPLFTVLGTAHAIGHDQREGTPFERVLEIMSPYWHGDAA